MKQFTFDIQEKIVRKEHIELILDISNFDIQDLIDFFPWNKPDWYHVILRDRVDDIKITDKIIVSFDINHVMKEVENLLDLQEIENVLNGIDYKGFQFGANQSLRIVDKINYIVNKLKAPVAE